MGSRRTIKSPQRTVNLQPTQVVVVLENHGMVEEEVSYNQDVLVIEGPLLQAKEACGVNEPAQEEKKQQKLLYDDKQAGKWRWNFRRLQ